MYNKKFMTMAIQQAELNLNPKTQSGGPFGTVIVKDDKLIARGRNHVLSNNDPTAHGEIIAIRNACQELNTYDLSGCELYTNAYPCPMCLSAIIWSNIKTCYYGNTAEDAKELGFRDDFIYKFINNGCQDDNILKLCQHDRVNTIKAFEKFKNSEIERLY